VADLVEVLWIHQLAEVLQNFVALPRIEALICKLKSLNLEKERQKLVETLAVIHVNLKNGFKCLLAFGELVHCAVVDRVSFHNSILLSEDFSVAM
jgi:hypothetical protein